MKSRLILGIAALMAAAACSEPSVEWIEGAVGEDGRAAHTLIIKDVHKGDRIWFQELYDNREITGGPVKEFHHYQGTSFYIDIPENGTITIPYLGRPLPRHSWAPEGFILQRKGISDMTLDVKYQFLERQGTEPDSSWFTASYEPGVTDIIPAVKMVNCKSEFAPGKRPQGWYRITIGPDGEAKTEADDEDGAFYASVTLSKLGEGAKDLTIEDWPDLPIRGFMLDVVRDFRSKEEVYKILDIMADYKLNLLHFHLGDDESWCLEMPEIPELTSFGAYHELPNWELKETRGLKPQAGGRIGNFTSYSQEDYKDILRYAWERRITVVPEFDAPGHSRAAIRSIEAYEERTGDTSFRLQNPADTSKYMSAQEFSDNALDPEYPGVYKFYGMVFREVKRLHEEAGVPLAAIHVGGDEVPDGAWAGRDRVEMKDLFTKGIIEEAKKCGIKLAGWQEIAQGIKDDTLKDLKPLLYFVNVWSTRGNKINLVYELANDGIPVLLSNVQNAYIDLAYSDGPEEIGLTWGGYVDERKSFALQPWNVYESARWKDIDTPIDLTGASEGRPVLKSRENIVGAEALLWSENIRSIDDATYQMLPKAIGIWERAWNASPEWPTDEAFREDFNRFYSIIVKKEMPRWQAAGLNFKKRN